MTRTLNLAPALALSLTLTAGTVWAMSHSGGAPMAAKPAAAGTVAITEPADGATVSSPFKLKFAVSGMAVAPAGEMKAGSGHHHLLIDVGPMAAGQTIPADTRHLHFGKGQTEAEVTLPPGTYKLTAQFADGAHQSYGPALSKTISVTVK